MDLLVLLETNIITGVSKSKYRLFYSVFIIALPLSPDSSSVLELGNLARLTLSKTKHSRGWDTWKTCKREIRNAIVTVMEKKTELPPCGQIWFPIHKIRLPQLKPDLEDKMSRKIWLQESKPHTKRHWTQEPKKKSASTWSTQQSLQDYLLSTSLKFNQVFMSVYLFEWGRLEQEQLWLYLVPYCRYFPRSP